MFSPKRLVWSKASMSGRAAGYQWRVMYSIPPLHSSTCGMLLPALLAGLLGASKAQVSCQEAYFARPESIKGKYNTTNKKCFFNPVVQIEWANDYDGQLFFECPAGESISHLVGPYTIPYHSVPYHTVPYHTI